MSDTLYLCATTRLAQTLRGELPAESQVWRTRQALSLSQWLASLADEATLTGEAELPTALDPYAEKLLWEKIIAASLTEAAPLFDLPGMAKAAAEAHALCRVWHLEPASAALADEAKLFIGWQADFVDRCRQLGQLDLAGVQRQILALIEDGRFALPPRVVFAGFDRLTPFEQRLAAALNARGVAVEIGLENSVDRKSAEVHACADLAAECAAAAAWAAEQLAANPAARVGIVAPNLAGVRDRLEFLLDDLLHPELIRPDGSELPRRFNFSLGRPLADLPLIRLALDLLALGNGRAKLEQARLSALLLAGGWAAAQAEADGRALLAAAMRRDLPYFTSPAALWRLSERLAESAAPLCPQSMAALAAGCEVFGEFSGKQLPGAWAQLCKRALRAYAWPGDRPLSSPEFQARRSFLEVLDGFGRFDALLGKISAHDAVRRLRELCRERLFQPETKGRPAIQALGTLESAGLQFDALWVMGMNDDQWPPAPRPNPLLPAELLRAVGASHASAEVELDFARRVHARLLAAAPEVHFSWSRADGNRVLRPSPLLNGLPFAVNAPPEAKMPPAAQFTAKACEELPDAQAPLVGAGEKVSGGSWLLRAQAICPAWAYYQYRLGAEAMETPVEGLDPAARGTLVHAALEALWTALRDSQTLRAMDEAARLAAIGEAVTTALAEFENERRIKLPERFRQLEGERLTRLLLLWLSVEDQRGGDFSVIACEAPAEIEIEGIKVRMIVDRIDRLADGRQVIIDYKTGAAIDIKNWASQRLTEPQLPIYAALIVGDDDDAAAVVFAKVLLDKPGFAGIADEKDLLPGVQGIGDDKQKVFAPDEFPDWIAVITHWRERLHAIAREVKDGVAGVSFADEKALQYCEVLPLLRLPERRRMLSEAAQ
ncbi:MAG: PD-(D/E)XK nuclease family protein [Rhodocyclales bacterium]|nr:PD-(D/E)XK nuclease family protein [Rhodocyclales bacterium]MCE1184345.1 PD-(D/E)XK nuclease family protein [Rhodocyclales bacterium]